MCIKFMEFNLGVVHVCVYTYVPYMYMYYFVVGYLIYNMPIFFLCMYFSVIV